MIHEVLRGSLTTPGWQPKETKPNCHSKTPRSRGLPTVGKQLSRLGPATLTQIHVVTPSGCGRHCATPFFTTVSMPCWRADAEKETTAHSVLFPLQYLLRRFPRDALHRFTALSKHWPFAGDREGTPEWADSFFSRERSRPSCSSFSSAVRVRRVP